MKKEQRQVLDAAITKSFLAGNVAVVNEIIKIFSGKMCTTFKEPKFKFYLKGGNALSLLKGVTTTGDYDFQLAPSPEVYAEWAGYFTAIDQGIINAMLETIKEVFSLKIPPVLNVKCFDLNEIIAMAEAAEPKISFVALTSQGKQENLTHIGEVLKHGSKTFKALSAMAIQGDGRISATKVIPDAPVIEKKGLKVYVNYTIPGFILYRMVCSYGYKCDGETIELKSEIIDVSVPRPGSQEVYMSQEGVVTYFRPVNTHSTEGPFKDCAFKIPGWGYHFYENINLLQEIDLGISSSTQKKDKRKARLAEAIEMLTQRQNAKSETAKLQALLSEKIYEPGVTDDKQILGYFGALAYTIYNYDKIYNEETITLVKKHILVKLRNEYNNFILSTNYKSKTLEDRLVYFKMLQNTQSERPKFKDVMSAPEEFIDVFSILNCEKQLISPSVFTLDQKYPFDYIVVEVNKDGYEAMRSKIIEAKVHRTFNTNSPKAFYIVATVGKQTIEIIFQNAESNTLKKHSVPNTEFLTRSILISQRIAFT